MGCMGYFGGCFGGRGGGATKGDFLFELLKKSVGHGTWLKIGEKMIILSCAQQ